MVNGYMYLGMTAPTGAAAKYEAAPAGMDVADAWFDFYVPRVREVARELTTLDWDAMDVATIRRELDPAIATIAGAFASTMAPLGHLAGPIAELVAFCAKHFGGNGEVRAMTLVQGQANETAAIGERLAELATEARSSPALREAVLRGDVGALDGVPGAVAWLERWRRFLEEYGSGTQTWFQFHDRPWIEEPSVPLSMLARMVAGSADTTEARERAARQREEALEKTVDELPGDAERDELRALLARNAAYVAVIEDRARWQLVLAAVPRAPVLAAGRKLVAAGSIASADDVYFIHLDELETAASRSFEAEVAARKADLARWAAVSPPEQLGAVVPGIERLPMLRQQFGIGAPPAGPPGSLAGYGAGGGSVTAVARILRDPGDIERLGPGEILVCRSTAPPWTPLFAIAGGVVTESGGVLSHAAIAAREYGLPAAVGVREATLRIPDGALVTVDGDAGTVTWEP
jgi:pyruvate,water dikinase